jgi:tRNA threonylcarbamoyladenosine biosynthesis protein TsaE
MTDDHERFKVLEAPAPPDAPEPPLLRYDLALRDIEATSALAARLAACARTGDVLALAGDLGVGKTTFARAFIHAIGHAQEEVPSPTFTLVQVYPAAAPAAPAVFHFDLYRLSAAEDALELGLEEALATGISLIEWPDRLGTWRRGNWLDLAFTFAPGETARTVAITAHGTWRGRRVEAGFV